MTSPTEYFNGRQTIAVVGNQWGDECKGAVVDLLSEGADVIARFVGGPNAGHTVVIGDESYAFHEVPSGILRDDEGKLCLMTRGTAICPPILLEELTALANRGKTFNNFFISGDAKLIMPQHIAMDFLPQLLSGSLDIGTTLRGMGPCMADHTARSPGLVVNDMRNPDVLRRKLEKNLEIKRLILQTCDPEDIKSVMHHERLNNGAFYCGSRIFDIDAIVDAYVKYGKQLGSLIRDTDQILRSALRSGKNVLLEASQGLLLDKERGTRPYVTSSLVTREGIAHGSGLNCSIDLVIGVVKAIQARVGNGPMPTELGGEQSYDWCQRHKIGAHGVTRADERRLYPDVSINDPDPFLQGLALRRASNDYGTTTGRPRRVGWLDLALLRHAVNINGAVIAVTMLDVLRFLKAIGVCDAHRYAGPRHEKNGRQLEGQRLTAAYSDAEILEHCKPQISWHDGWDDDLNDCREYNDLPEACRRFIEYVTNRTRTQAPILKFGPQREQSILRPLVD